MRSRDCPYFVIKMVWPALLIQVKCYSTVAVPKGTITLLSVVIVNSNSAANSDYALPT